MATVGKNRKSQWLTASGGLLLAVMVVGYLLTRSKESSAVHANAGVTTERAAARADAKVLPTDPPLKVEPK